MNVSGVTYQVDFFHMRKDKPEHTLCIIEYTNSSGELVRKSLGNAILSDSDQYNRKKGRKVAFARALKSANFNKLERTSLWNQYFQYCNL